MIGFLIDYFSELISTTKLKNALFIIFHMLVFLQCHTTERCCLLGEIGTVACFRIANIFKTQSLFMQWNLCLFWHW